MPCVVDDDCGAVHRDDPIDEDSTAMVTVAVADVDIRDDANARGGGEDPSHVTIRSIARNDYGGHRSEFFLIVMQFSPSIFIVILLSTPFDSIPLQHVRDDPIDEDSTAMVTVAVADVDIRDDANARGGGGRIHCT